MWVRIVNNIMGGGGVGGGGGGGWINIGKIFINMLDMTQETIS